MKDIKIISVSDSHGSRDKLRLVCNMHPDADYLFHTGDGVHDVGFISSFKGEKLCVCGNCDFFSDFPDEIKKEIGGYKFCLCHGHNHGVKFSTAALERKAISQKTDVVVFGHTHNPIEKTVPIDDGKYLYLFNPGSLKEGSFGLIQISGAGIILSHGTLK